MALGHTLSTDGSIMPLNNQNARGGSSQVVSTYRSVAEFTGLMIPAREGYVFAGWETETFAYDMNEANPVFHLTLKATWDVQTYAINYDLSGGSLLGEAPVEYTTEDGDILIPPARKDGFVFLGWLYEGITEPEMEVTIPAGSVGNMTFVAQWEGESYTITLDYGMEGKEPGKLDIQCGDNLTLEAPERPGYVFDGWWEGGSVKVQNGVWDRAESVTLVAKWHMESYSIRYHLNGGRNAADNPTRYTVETDTFGLSAPTREGYTFLGWSRTARTPWRVCRFPAALRVTWNITPSGR